MTNHGDGVWISIRLSASLRLYHAETLELLQDFDLRPSIEPILSEFNRK